MSHTFGVTGTIYPGYCCHRPGRVTYPSASPSEKQREKTFPVPGAAVGPLRTLTAVAPGASVPHAVHKLSIDGELTWAIVSCLLLTDMTQGLGFGSPRSEKLRPSLCASRKRSWRPGSAGSLQQGQSFQLCEA